ncbi:MAG TPA: hypothetical protein VFA30_08125 [Gaiellaceae bacterium]|nr:hypothetical protein [Gaiellaceae bacterium]
MRCVLPLVVAAYVLCGCGGGGDPLSQVKASAQKTIGVHWLRYQLAFDRPRLFEPSLQVAGGRAVFNVDARLGYEVLTLRERGGGSRLLWLDVTPTAFLVDPDPPPAGVLPAGKIWISAGYSGANAVAAQAEGLSAELPLDEIAWGAQTATRIRTSVVGHVPMAEYRVVVDLTKALSAARTAHLRSIAAAIAGERRAGGVARLSLLVWVNGPGFVGRIDETVPGAGLGAVTFMFTSYTLRYTGTLPPSSQIVPLESLSPGGRSIWSVATGS